MFDEFGQISSLQGVVLDILVSPGMSPGPLVTIVVHSTATGASAHLMVPDHVTVQALLNALAMADKTALLVPPTVAETSSTLWRPQTQQVLNPDDLLLQYNLQPGERLDLCFSSRRISVESGVGKSILRNRPEPTKQVSGSPTWLPLLAGIGGLILVGGVGLLLVLCVIPYFVDLLLTPTPSAHSSQVTIVATATPNEVVPAKFTPTAMTLMPTSTAQPAPTAVNCTDTSPYGLNEGQVDRIGCPIQDWVSNRAVVIQQFEGGVMVIFAKPSNVFDEQGGGAIYVLADDQRAWRVVDTFVETSSNPDDWYACERRAGQRPEVSGIPWRGFGKVWCEHSEIREALGNVRSAEKTSSASFQSYESGRAFQVFNWKSFSGWDPNRVYIVFLQSADGSFSSGTWK